MSRQQRQSVTTRPWRLRKRVLPQHTDHAGVMWHGAYAVSYTHLTLPTKVYV